MTAHVMNGTVAQAVRTAVEAQAAKTAEAVIEMRSCKYAVAPKGLDTIEPGLSKLTPRQLRKRLAGLLSQRLMTSPYPTALGADIPLINIRAAMRYADKLVDIANEARIKRDTLRDIYNALPKRT